MKIRTRLTLLFTIITAMLMIFYGIAVYYSSSEAREVSFYAQLRNEAVAKANLFFQSTLNEKEMHRVYKNNTKTINEVQVAIYDPEFNLVYHDDSKVDFVKEDPKMLSSILKKKEISFFIDDLQAIGMVYTHNGKEYLVTAAGYDQYGYKSINHLLTISIIAFISILIFIYLAGIFLAKKALYPLSEMVHQIKNITAGKLQLRLKTTGEKDELNELAQNFNGMLERLENSFDAQKHFVSNISHELRTPLSAIITELEFSSEKEQTKAEYQQTIQYALDDARNMAKLSNSLMDLAKASYDPNEISFYEVRLDEILLESYSKILKENQEYKISLNIDSDTEEHQLVIWGNEYLLRVAFNNLIDNACKYSPVHTCRIDVKATNKKLYISFINTGITISQEDLLHIFEPFYRSEASKQEKGYGIGLFLTKKIIDLHHAAISMISENNTTVFTVVFDIEAI
ncbi:HAMP domain-containing sensor histidine kinase [Chryseobacterium bernardetii]|uniref:histidine kinase n=1 Tax=Chryseobacterium bernardetii TaxID=1241978 RepID=A0A3G6T1K5_9FLAO|nr:ATP-binding protein [Chryseobacterium bernardetii]AZB23232.1 HAMP domain-containing protein [Chryseobacterium bernardetii]AZB34013.1 HAMP domain-containing protein [Chryseobacterium bernardetii]